MNEQEQNQTNKWKSGRTAEQILEDNGYDSGDFVLLKDESYDSALIAVSDDFRAVYSYDKMVECVWRRTDAASRRRWNG